ncbi:hypothetical protein OJAV_G00184200, partial [Oryzias javanicus]
MKRGSSVLQPPSDAAKRRSHPAGTHSKMRAGDAARSHSESTPGTCAAGSSPFPAATSLFSPDVSTKMASDLLIRLSEATQKTHTLPGSAEDPGQQEEPGVALSPDGPGASPEPPSLTHTPDSSTAADTLASDLLRKLAERQEVSSHVLRVKEEEEPMDIDTMAQNQQIKEDIPHSTLGMECQHLFTVKSEEHGLPGNSLAEQCLLGSRMSEQFLLGLQMEDRLCGGSFQTASESHPDASKANKCHYRMKVEDCTVFGARMDSHLLPRAGVEDQLSVNATVSERPASGPKTSDKFLPGAKMAAQLFPVAPTDEQLFFGAKMEDQCLRAVLWQDMSVNLASTLLHQLSERVGKSSNQQVERMTPPTRNSAALKVDMEAFHPLRPLNSQETPPESRTSPGRDQTTGCSYFFRCHVCGFETEGHALFQSHMTEHRQWEQSCFSLHCCICSHSTNQEAEMRGHMDTHLQGDAGQTRCGVALPASSSSALAVAVATQAEKTSPEHCCRICQRSFPGQQELQVHFQGHRQGNQYRCDRCGHLTRTANKLVEHVRVHTGERPFTCQLCPYSAKRRDSLRLHCKIHNQRDDRAPEPLGRTRLCHTPTGLIP